VGYVAFQNTIARIPCPETREKSFSCDLGSIFEPSAQVGEIQAIIHDLPTASILALQSWVGKLELRPNAGFGKIAFQRFCAHLEFFALVENFLRDLGSQPESPLSVNCNSIVANKILKSI
jgi:hypothetical protein